MAKAPKPVIFAVEGPDGAGKSTVIEDIQGDFQDQVFFTRAPGGTPLGERLRDILLDPAVEINPISQAYLFFASHAQMLEELGRRSARENKPIVTDRLELSTLIFQSSVYACLDKSRYSPIDRSFSDGLDDHSKFYKHLLWLASTLFASADIRYIFVDASDEVLDYRLEQSGKLDRFESSGEEVIRRIRADYRLLAHEMNDGIRAIKVSTDEQSKAQREQNRRRVSKFIDSHRQHSL